MTTIQFCPECNNMLYPKEDRAEKKLLLTCRHCEFEKPAENPTVYIHKIKKDTAMRLDLVDPALSGDPTLPRTYDTNCEKCGGNEAVFFMSRSGGRDSDMALVFLCVNSACHHKWLN
uniref:DNA-directed RNA polymerase subunit n=1 Tax=Aplanochytrium stocchinoi TaxID=215587 RepID=A0A6S8ESB1_9STRA|mmetsp:Transcript_18384/g.22515  ORF Transcript_18384/g.22515 Transcript_18384/m.22515 type:complete len:117 (-) Transcript_18384:810-1160(-)